MSHKESSTLKAGAARVEITPALGTQLAGDIGRRRPLEEVIDPLYARVLVLESGDRKLCIVSLDVLAVTTACADEIRRQAVEELGFDRGAVMLHDTQNHAAPSLGHFMVSDRTPYIPPALSWLRGGDDAFIPYAIERIIGAVRQANAALEPVEVGAGSGIEGRVASNRRFIMRNGRLATHPAPGSPLIRHVEGPMDPELGVVCFRGVTGNMAAMLLSYTCHPCHGYPHHYTIGDWPGAWCTAMQEAYGTESIPLVLNGCCGNIHHTNHLDPKQVSEYHRMADLLAETARDVIAEIAYRGEVVLDWRTVTIAIPRRTPSPDEVAAARSLLAQHPKPKWLDEEHTAVDWDWFFAVSLLDLVEERELSPMFQCEIQAFRIGDIALVALPGEPFAEGQLQIKLGSPTYPTYVAHHCNILTNYVPTVEGFYAGGFEAERYYAARLAPEALDMMVHTALKLLKELFSEKPDVVQEVFGERR